jgi:glutaredoxin-like YruB-family protein
MALKEVSSHPEMLKQFDEKKKNYLLLYKKGTENSECSVRNIEEALENVKDVNLVAADVTLVRDIHPNYDVKTVPTLLVFEGDSFVKTVKGCNDADYYVSLFESALYSAKVDDNEKPQKRVTVYSTPTCSWCNTLKTHLRKNGIRFTDVDVSKDQKAAEAMVKKSGQQGVPQTDINGKVIVGFDKQKINTLLGING